MFNDFFSRITLQTKIFSVGIGLPAVIISLLLVMYSSETSKKAVDNSVDKARSLCDTAESARAHAETQWENQLISQQQLREWGDNGEQEKLLSAVPIIAAWEIAAAKSKEGGYQIRTPALEPRNGGNAADEMQQKALLQLRNDKLAELTEVDEATNSVHYFRPVRLSNSCLICHGDPITSKELWGTDDGTDVTGHKMENWKAGDMHGAFEVVQSLDEATSQAHASIFSAFLVAGFSLIVAAIVTVMTLKSVKSKIVETSEVIGKSVIGLVGNSSQLQEDAGDTLTKTKEMAVAVTETTESINSVSDAIQQMELAIGEIAQRSTEATAVAEDAVEKSRHTVDVIQKLDTNSSRINNVVGVIHSLAEQTNLLALNATIEAARAGQYGKGFAVVASEVKQLASQTAEATKDIGEVVAAIRSGTRESIESVEVISGVIDQISSAQGAIASAVEEQNATTREIVRYVHDIAESSESLSAQIQIVSGSSARTNERVQESTRLISEISDASDQVPLLVGIGDNSAPKQTPGHEMIA